MFEKLRYKLLNRTVSQFIAEKNGCKLPDFERLSSVIIILEDLDKQTVRTIEDCVRNAFGISRIRLIIISEKASEDILLSDQYCEVTTKDFGYMKVLKAEKQEEIRKLPSFRVSFTKSDYSGIYDLIIDNGKNSSPTSDIKVLHDYLLALSGN